MPETGAREPLWKRLQGRCRAALASSVFATAQRRVVQSKIVGVLITLCAIVPGGAAAELTGTVIAVSDGDTLAVMVGQRVLNIRLAQIDAPEIGQPFGARARQSLEELCDAKPVTLDELGFGQDRRVFGEVECDGVDVREEQVRRGMAWVHDEQVEDSRLVALQVEARAQGRGLWSDSSPTPPWEWEPLPSLKITP